MDFFFKIMKKTKRKAFNFLRSYFDVLNKIELDKDKLSFLMSIINKSFLNEDPENLNFLVDLCYESQRHSIEKSIKGWESVSKIPLKVPTQAPYEGTTKAPNLQVEVKVKEEVKDKVEKFFIKTSNQEKNVKLKNSEVETLKEKLGEKGFLFCVNKLSDYKLAKGATYKSDYGAINSWVIKEWDKQQINGKEKLTGAAAFLNQLK